MKKIWILLMTALLALGLLIACGGKETTTEAKEVPVEDILQAVKDAYGENYLPDTAIDAETLGGMYDINMDLIAELASELPMIGVHPDRVIIAKAVDGKGEELEAEFQALRDYLVEDSFMYPINMAKTQAAQVVRNGDYVAFLLVGAPNDNLDASEEEQLKFAEEQTKIGVDAFNACFQ